jgi:hypothetical protein
VVAAHEDRGVGWLTLGDKKDRRRVDSDLTVVLRPAGSISGHFVSPEQTPIAQATINLHYLGKPAR